MVGMLAAATESFGPEALARSGAANDIPRGRKSSIFAPISTCWAKVRMALDRRNYRQLVDTTVEIANKVVCLDLASELQ